MALQQNMKESFKIVFVILYRPTQMNIYREANKHTMLFPVFDLSLTSKNTFIKCHIFCTIIAVHKPRVGYTSVKTIYGCPICSKYPYIRLQILRIVLQQMGGGCFIV